VLKHPTLTHFTPLAFEASLRQGKRFTAKLRAARLRQQASLEARRQPQLSSQSTRHRRAAQEGLDPQASSGHSYERSSGASGLRVGAAQPQFLSQASDEQPS